MLQPEQVMSCSVCSLLWTPLGRGVGRLLAFTSLLSWLEHPVKSTAVTQVSALLPLTAEIKTTSCTVKLLYSVWNPHISALFLTITSQECGNSRGTLVIAIWPGKRNHLAESKPAAVNQENQVTPMCASGCPLIKIRCCCCVLPLRWFFGVLCCAKSKGGWRQLFLGVRCWQQNGWYVSVLKIAGEEIAAIQLFLLKRN